MDADQHFQDYAEFVRLRNAAITADRLFGGSVEDPKTWRCSQCGDLLHPYPEPEYWMQYPLPTCCILDDLKFCDDYRKPDCIAAYLVEHPDRPIVEIVPVGYALVDVVLTAHQAFIVRKWASAAKTKIQAENAQYAKTRLDARKSDGFGHIRPGERCKIISVHHPVFSSDVDKIVVVTSVDANLRQVWAHDDKPVIYKMNQKGRKVVVFDPRSIQTVYSMDQLRVL